jgi:di- and tripeptidase
LDVNVVFLIEGEEESGSVGFYEAVDKNKELFQDVDMVLLRYL